MNACTASPIVSTDPSSRISDTHMAVLAGVDFLVHRTFSFRAPASKRSRRNLDRAALANSRQLSCSYQSPDVIEVQLQVSRRREDIYGLFALYQTPQLRLHGCQHRPYY